MRRLSPLQLVSFCWPNISRDEAADTLALRPDHRHAFNLGFRAADTDQGFRQAEHVVRKHRIWEVYLAQRLALPVDHVHRDAEAMEHALSDDAVLEFEELLGFPELDPHGQKIPPRRET